ncbi:MAG: hypothetical protein A3H98_11435 [Bacteroidetes bacterium RIFCSPLOWO2_02_FULL_36_8]|nr:MAG: hypothetical protein A3H98_11435 [Bacteroidetes bacterium RIFCSPLOWO2_02_FULL_36_8]OFY69090.1 MAG: hypothetical protein A3G23_05940 [Bacteroidetes bacterium RIFCSPLOWO2_12_FULL_37_12]
MISVQNLSIHFGDRYLFNDVSFLIRPEDKIGLVGRNGSGKTTLLKILAGIYTENQKSIHKPTGLKIGYLPQEIIYIQPNSIIQEVMSSHKEIQKLVVKIRETEHALAHAGEPAEHSVSSLPVEHAGKSVTLELFSEHSAVLNHLYEELRLIDGHLIKEKTEKILTGLGFERNDFDNDVSQLSGGWQMRVELAKILLQNPDLMMLDEPTNHLDMDSLLWLENFLSSYKGCLILVSHDRVFMNNLCNRIFDLQSGNLRDFKSNYLGYEALKQQQQEHLLAVQSNQLKEIEHNKKFIERFRYKASKAKQVQSRIKMIDKIELVIPEEEDLSKIRITFPNAPRTGVDVFKAENISKAYNQKEVFREQSFSIYRGDRIAFVGRNGEGKSTLSRILAGTEPYQGKLTTGYNVQIGYFAQHNFATLNPAHTVLETIESNITAGNPVVPRKLLGAFLFSGDTVYKKVSVLSGGEKTRLSMAKLLLEPVNVLILDEPTHHLDLITKDILKKSLMEFSGTLVLVSHDREFLSGLVNQVYEFKNKKIHQFPYDIEEYLSRKKMESLAELNSIKKSKAKEGLKIKEPANPNIKEKERQADKEKKQHEHRRKQLEEKISSLEKEKSECESKLSDPVVYNDKDGFHTILDRYNRVMKELEEMYKKWEAYM